MRFDDVKVSCTLVMRKMQTSAQSTMTSRVGHNGGALSAVRRVRQARRQQWCVAQRLQSTNDEPSIGLRCWPWQRWFSDFSGWRFCWRFDDVFYGCLSATISGTSAIQQKCMSHPGDRPAFAPPNASLTYGRARSVPHTATSSPSMITYRERF